MGRTPLQILRRKRNEALASIAVRRRSIAKLEARVAAIEAQMAPLTNKMDARHALRIPRRSHGEIQRLIFDLLRERETITSADVAAALAASWGLDYQDKATGWALRQRAIQALRRLARGRFIAQAGGVGKGGKLKAWRAGNDTLGMR